MQDDLIIHTLRWEILRHQYGIFVAESQTFLLAKRPQRRRAKEKRMLSQSKRRPSWHNQGLAPSNRIIKKNLCDIFSKHGLKITIKANKKNINFLDVSLNLSTGTHMPFNKPNIPLYIKQKSNHTPRIISNIRQSINRRLSEISYDKESFEKAAPFYQKALDNSSYKHLLTFSSNIPTKLQTPRQKIGRETSFGTTLHLARTSPLTSGIPSLSYLTRNSQGACVK